MILAGEPIRLIVNADDLGWSQGVNAGIFRAHREGIVTSATLAANMPAAGAALAEAAKPPGLGIGVHLNACQGPPMSRRGAAVLAGRHGLMNLKGTDVVRKCVLRPRRTLGAIEAEFDAQIGWCVLRGLRPTHVDTHRHVHAWGPVFRLVCRLCQRYDIRFVRQYREVLAGQGWPEAHYRQKRTSKVLSLLGWRCRRIQPRLLATNGTLGVAHTGRIGVAFLLRAIQSLEPGTTELMVHPACGDDLDAEQTRLRTSRRMEFRALCDPSVAKAIAERNIELIHYGQLQ